MVVIRRFGVVRTVRDFLRPMASAGQRGCRHRDTQPRGQATTTGLFARRERRLPIHGNLDSISGWFPLLTPTSLSVPSRRGG
ncbi:hypothetical protein RBSWK_03894 [Rhodopirellula baltica SWK14]|uniref:Uncharacterized protein n=1 Tax=Rhodopirellula baltica SWK14 TaxID=993516 RepID=L7CEB7_RHOBT|nr:hypothetical protein RBSWK_03894 [Rhodopirellula baltica SWK14]